MNKVYVYDAGAEATRADKPDDDYLIDLYLPHEKDQVVNRIEVKTYAGAVSVRCFHVETRADRCSEPLFLRLPLPAVRALAEYLQAAIDDAARNREAGKKGRYARKARSRGGDGETPSPAADALPGGPEAR
jgi:hypothetical protein